MHMLYGLSEGVKYKVIVTYSDLRAKEIYEEYRFYDRNVLLYPAKDLIFFQADIHGNQLMKERIRCLRRILEGKPVTLVTTFSGLMAPQIPLRVLEESVISISKRGTVNEAKLAVQLVAMGYEKTYQVENPGQFSIRGGIIDIFDLTEENPYRIELWGEDVDSIRSFDVLSQRSIEKLESVTIYPATEMVLSRTLLKDGFARIEKEAEVQIELFRNDFKTEEAHRIKTQIAQLKEQVMEFQAYTNLESYVRYFYEDTTTLVSLFANKSHAFFLDEPARIKEHGDAVELEFRESMSHRAEKGYVLPTQMDLLYPVENVMGRLGNSPIVALSAIDLKNTLFKPDKKYDIDVKSMASYNNSFDALLKDLKRYKKNGYRVLLLSGSRSRAKRLAQDLREQEITAVYSEDPFREVLAGEVLALYGRVLRGFEYPLLKFVVISESDIFGAEKKKKKKKKLYEGQKIRDFAELKIGDYVVHESHGLGIYCGIETIEVEKVAKDYIKIEYRDGGKLYIPATGLDVIQKYASADAKTPKLNKLGTKEWSKTKTRVRGAVQEIAKDLVELYAKRQQSEGYKYGKDTVWQKEFEEMFPFEETEDQLLAIEATKQDMESTKIMDRLVCGDVGYGKTEIAIRAAFKAVQEGKQVVYLVPTTILAQQHYNTFVQRMKDFPIRVDLLSRFRTTGEQKKTLVDLKKGFVDIVIGTHRILSKDLVFKDLGLLVLDEEQRFGVEHKEKIKLLKKNVDAITLTATPIPRTLQMSMSGVRSLALIETAPAQRLPIQTYVLGENNNVIKDALYKELSRNGQAFILYNHVDNIESKMYNLNKLVPEAKMDFAHGQMTKTEIEDKMQAFIDHKFDVLVCTTIIETGIDIPNVNTLIIMDADRFGLSQLYQIRGRIGRSDKIGYAYLMYDNHKELNDIAVKRLNTIKEFTELGSGFKIAMRDLSIRGAGDILGSEQSGFIDTIGIELYLKMLKDAVDKIKGNYVEEEVDENLDNRSLIEVDTHIGDDYIKDDDLKIEIHKKINEVNSLDKLNEVRAELEDRFGKVSREMEIYMYEEWFEKLASKLEIKRVRQTKTMVDLELSEVISKKINGEELFMLSYEVSKRFKLSYKENKIHIILEVVNLEKHFLLYLIELLQKIIESLKLS